MMKKITWLLMTIGLLLLGTTAFAESDFIEVKDVGGIEGSCYYLYTPTEMYNPSAMMTPVVYLYPDKAYADKDEAFAELKELGLIDIAEAEKGAVIVVNPLGDTWSKADIDVFEAIQADIYYASRGGGNHAFTQHNLQYVIGEGAGATFINERLSQNCKRIAGVLTFGGEYNFAYQLYNLPAYIVSGSEGAIEYFKGTNKTDAEKTEDGKTIYYNTINPIQQVIVSDAKATSFDAEVIADCWESMFRYTTRLSLTESSFSFPFPKYNTADYTLMSRPNYKAAGMEVVEHGGNPLWEDDKAATWYEFVPAAALNAAEGETFPLLLVLHGANNHAIFEAEFNGWAQLAIDHNLIAVSPMAPRFGVSASDIESMFGLIDYMIEKYPVDTSRIYVVGFSMGGMNTFSLINTKPELFAAAAPMAAPFYNGITIDPTAYEYDIDIPICILGNQFDENNANCGVLDNSYKFPQEFNDLAALNEATLDDGVVDIERYPYWGVPFENTARIMNKTGFAFHTGFRYDEAGVPMVYSLWVEDLTHNHFVEDAEMIWRWMQHFSRDTETKAVIYSAE